MKKLLAQLLALAVTVCVSFSAVACGSTTVDEDDPTKTNIYVAIYSGGYGTDWLGDREKWLGGAVERFEQKYAETEFEPGTGKKGVKVHVTADKSYTGQVLETTVPYSENIDVYFAAGVPLFELENGNSLLDITDLVTGSNSKYVCSDGKTIQDKLTPEYKDSLAYNGKYYAIPLYDTYSCPSYDAGVFKTKKLYFSDRLDTTDTTYPGTNAFVLNDNDTKSCGPDGVFGTYDDGLPSSFQEFYKMMDKMTKNSVTPFVVCESDHYSNHLLIALAASYMGAEALSVTFDFDSNGEALDIVTGWNGTTPITTSTVITRENAYNIKQHVGFYYALELCQKVFSNSQYYETSATMSHTDAMRTFMKSGLDGKKYCAMILDGSWWYNEANEVGVFDDMKKMFPTTYQKKDVKLMPMPHQYAGTVTPRDASEAIDPVLFSGMSTYSFISKNISSEKIDAAKLFLSFCYGDDELVESTKVSNGVMKAVQYDFTDAYAEANSYARSVFDLSNLAKQNGTAINAFSSDPIFSKNSKYWNIGTTSDFWTTQTSGGSYRCIREFKNTRLTAKDFFTGLALSSTQWSKYYVPLSN